MKTSSPARWKSALITPFLLPTTNDRVPQVYVENHRVLNLDPADPLWVGPRKPSADHPTGITHRNELKMDWSNGHNGTIHNGISRIGFYTGGHAARFRDEDLADKWVEKSKEWITANKDNPFFLFFASHDLHVPRMPHERFHGKSRMGWRGDAIVQLDWCVGEIVNILKEQGLAENTMIVFCSDNGPALGDGYKDDAKEKLHDHKPAGPTQVVNTESKKAVLAHPLSPGGREPSIQRFRMKSSAPSTWQPAWPIISM